MDNSIFIVLAKWRIRHRKAVKHFCPTSLRMRLHVLHLMVVHVVSHGDRIRDGGRLKFCFPFSLSCKPKCMTIPTIYGCFISVLALLIVWYGLNFCYESIDLFQFCP